MKSLTFLSLVLLLPISSMANSPCLVTPNDEGNYTITIEGPINQSGTITLNCVDSEAIADHMREMSGLIQMLLHTVEGLPDPNDSENVRQNMMDMTRDLRFHLHQVFAKKPEKKLNAIDPNDHRKAQLVFQKYLSDIIIKTIEIEFDLTKAPTDQKERDAQYDRVKALLNTIDQIIKGAHAKFRDNL
ncbi:MAG: hypothetical protein KDD33_12555 [Bdellovibrionales bacterium]|nr:hypothetical protein [Bdellovibrionales bacterium]